MQSAAQQNTRRGAEHRGSGHARDVRPCPGEKSLDGQEINII